MATDGFIPTRLALSVITEDCVQHSLDQTTCLGAEDAAVNKTRSALRELTLW